jgi:hypothetical protein
MRQLFPFGGGGRGRPWGWRDAGRRRLTGCAAVREEGIEGRVCWAAQLAAGTIGPKARGNSFRNKIGILNLQRL